MQRLCSDVYMLLEHLLTASVVKGLNELGEIRNVYKNSKRLSHVWFRIITFSHFIFHSRSSMGEINQST